MFVRKYRVMQELHKVEAKGPFTIEKFTKFARTHQEMLFPAFQLQLHLQEKVCGRSFWSRCSNRRVELSKGKFVTMGELMELVSLISCLMVGLAEFSNHRIPHFLL